MTTNRAAILLIIAASGLAATPAYAELPDPVRKMIDAAIVDGNADQVAAIVAIAEKTNPDDVAEIKALHEAFLEARKAKIAAKDKRKVEQIRSARLLDLWKGKGEAGAFRSTGNNDSLGLTAGLTLERIGIDWRHKIDARADYQDQNGQTTREQYRLSYQPDYTVSDKTFVYGLGQYQNDRFQGFHSRISLSGGAGYRFYDRKDLNLEVKGGPAWRWTDYVDGHKESSLSGLAAMDFEWQLADGIRLTQAASAYVEQANSTYNSLTGIEAGFGKGLKTRLSYSYEHDTDPAPGAYNTDTMTRFTFIYGF